MQWTKQQFDDHKQAAQLLKRIQEDTFIFLSKNSSTTEFETQRFILEKLKDYQLKMDLPSNSPIVAFRQNTSFVHYYPDKKSKQLISNSLVLLDIWARLNKKGAPYADCTWMGYYGDRIPNKMREVFDLVIKARDEAINFINKELKNGIIPTGKQVDFAARGLIARAGYGDQFLHGTGHIIGFVSPHGRQRPIAPRNNHLLLKNVGYTIEPGIYLKDDFGVRSEINFYISEENTIVITSDVQNELIKI